MVPKAQVDLRYFFDSLDLRVTRGSGADVRVSEDGRHTVVGRDGVLEVGQTRSVLRRS